MPKPPRLRPRAGSVPLFFSAPAALTCAPDRAVQPHGIQIRIDLQVGHQARPAAPGITEPSALDLKFMAPSITTNKSITAAIAWEPLLIGTESPWGIDGAHLSHWRLGFTERVCGRCALRCSPFTHVGFRSPREQDYVRSDGDFPTAGTPHRNGSLGYGRRVRCA